MQVLLAPALIENPLDVRLSASLASLALAKSSIASSGKKMQSVYFYFLSLSCWLESKNA